MNLIWYSITAHDARKLLKDGQAAVADYQDEQKYAGRLDELHFRQSLHFWIDQGDEAQRYEFHLNETIFKTNDRQLEIIEPGVCCITVTL